ncbi:FkbM family methyltransferase [Sabulicella glaciei]|uniref:FkbM family methyltransferase n=1 Tax=Sabulicella glaciei TaxID=2984948 RepID=A0ABT3NT33_9PROT|nr:FkbM family methyltransferase [Roseococcus sp. MDT2-1-1]MCW8085311.1 FkbM family methyltransferase [Roseococcus sp. MDT2-1-1]
MEEIAFHRRLHRPGTILDIGAHDGLLTLPLSELPGSRVLAFEPLPSAFARLTAACAGRSNIELRLEALGERPGEAMLSLPVLDGVAQEQWASISKDYRGFSSVTVRQHAVPVVSLDSLALSDLVAVKLDAEGAEEAILRGGAGTLRRCRPILSVEVEERHAPGSTRAVPALLEGLGYAGFFVLDRLRPVAEFDATSMQRASPDPAVFGAEGPYVFTFFFLPTESQDTMLARLAGG